MDSNFISRFIKGLLSTSLGTLVTILVGFLNITIAVRFVSKEQFGTYIILQLIVYSIVMLTDIGINISTTRAIACASDNEKKGIVNTVVSGKLLMTLTVSIVILIAGKTVLSMIFDDLLTVYILPIILLFFLESYNSLYNSILQGLQNYKKLAVSQILLSISNLFSLVYLLSEIDNGLYALIYARQISLLLTLLYQVYAIQLRAPLHYDNKLFVSLLGFGFPLGLNNVLTFIFMRVDTLMIGALLNPVGVAYYGTASKIPDAGRQMFESFRSVYFPNVAELLMQNKKKEVDQLLNNALRSMTFLSTVCLLLAYLFKYEIVTILFTEKYLECAPVLSLLMFAMILGLIGYTLGTSLVAAGYSKLPVIINLVDTSVAVIANILFIPSFGIVGAAYAAITARAITLPVNVYFLKKYDIQVKSMEYIKPLLISIACILLFSLSTGGILIKLSVLILHISLCAYSSVITRYDLNWLIRAIKLQPLSTTQ